MTTKRGAGVGGPGGAAGTGREPSFESMMDRLDALVRKLEEGNLSLEESIRSFEEGMALVKQCTAVLQEAEQRIQKLTRDAGGKPATTPLEEPPAESPGGGDELPF
jgi:exodeoxyribonuclease VII small subunit